MFNALIAALVRKKNASSVPFCVVKWQLRTWGWCISLDFFSHVSACVCTHHTHPPLDLRRGGRVRWKGLPFPLPPNTSELNLSDPACVAVFRCRCVGEVNKIRVTIRAIKARRGGVLEMVLCVRNLNCFLKSCINSIVRVVVLWQWEHLGLGGLNNGEQLRV